MIKKLSVLMPVYNEEKSISIIMKKIEEVKFPFKTEIVIVDDCSSDNTKEELDKIKRSSKLDIKIFYHEKNKGKGGAIRTAIENMDGDIAIIQDADLEYNPEEISSLIEYMYKNNYDAVYGSRNLNKNNKHSYTSFYLGNILLNKITNLFYWSNITDMETCYKLIDAKIMKDIKLRSDGFNIEPEITAKLIRKGYRIGEYPISYTPRTKEEGKKIKWKDGISAIWTLIYWRFKRF